MPLLRRRKAAPGLLLAIALALGACSGDDDSAGGGGSAARVAAPLTGVQVAKDVAERPAVTVKVDNTDQGRGIQAGLDRADVILEEKVEGGFTRLVAVFHSEDADLIGPIRSLRTTDPLIVSPFGGVFAFSDAADVALRSLRGAPVNAVYEAQSQAPFVFPPGRRRPFATYAASPRLRAEAGARDDPPPAFAPFLGQGETFQPQAPPAVRASVNFGRTAALLTWDAAGSRWLRSTNGRPQTVGGAQLAFATVIVQKVNYRSVGYSDSAGNPVDEAVVVGSGEAVVLSQGRQIGGRWSKTSSGRMTTYTDPAGQPIRIPPGRTLVLLLPAGAAVTIS
jgi:hypothetical protein